MARCLSCGATGSRVEVAPTDVVPVCAYNLVFIGWANERGELYNPTLHGEHHNHRPEGFNRPLFVGEP